MKIFACETPWTHEYGWPQNGVQTCTLCGTTRKSKLEFPVNPRFNIPLRKLKAYETELVIGEDVHETI
jgi:hypothetical protein